MSRRRDFNFDDMLGTGEKASGSEATGQAQSGTPVNTGTQADDKGAAAAIVATRPSPTSPGITDLQAPVNTGIQESVRELVPAEQLIADLLADHAGLRTGTAKKSTFDFTPEFARALKRWSVDTDTSMRDLVLKAVAKVMPRQYLQEYRKPETQETGNKG